MNKRHEQSPFLQEGFGEQIEYNEVFFSWVEGASPYSGEILQFSTIFKGG